MKLLITFLTIACCSNAYTIDCSSCHIPNTPRITQINPYGRFTFDNGNSKFPEEVLTQHQNLNLSPEQLSDLNNYLKKFNPS